MISEFAWDKPWDFNSYADKDPEYPKKARWWIENRALKPGHENWLIYIGLWKLKGWEYDEKNQRFIERGRK